MKNSSGQWATFRGIRCSAGTSITECLVLLVILIPLCIAIPHLAKIADFKMNMPLTSRYLAWNEAIHEMPLNANESRLHLEERLLKSANLAIQTEQLSTGQDNLKLFWQSFNNVDPQNPQRLHEFTAQTTQVTRENLNNPTVATELAFDVVRNVSAAASFGGEGFNLADSGVIENQVMFEIDSFGLTDLSNCNTSDSNRNVQLCITERHVMYHDTLAANNPVEIRDQVNALKPFSQFERAFDVVAHFLHHSVLFEEGEHLEGAPSHVNTETLPQGRLEL